MTDKQAKRVIVVLCAGRSGTSLLMKALCTFGMRLSDNLVVGRHENPKVFFEDEDIVQIHKELFQILCTKPSLPLPDNWLQRPEIQKHRQMLVNKFQEKIRSNDSIWGFKDSRTSTFLPLWNKLFNQERVIPVFLLAIRSPSAFVTSNQRYYKINEELIELQWLQRTTDALHHTAAHCFIVHYEDWFTRPTEQAHGLLAYTSLDQYFTGHIDGTIKKIIKSNLNRAVYEDYHVQNEYVLKLYDVLKDCRGNEFDRERLIAMVKECRHAMNEFKGCYIEAQKYIGQRQAKTRERLSNKQEAKRYLKDNLVREQDQVNKKQAEIDNEMNNDLYEITLQNNEYLKQLKNLHDEKENLRISISSVQNDLVEIKKAKTALEQEKEKELKEKQGQLNRLSGEKENLHIRLNAVQNYLVEIKKAKTALEQEKEKELKEKQAQLKQAQADVDDLRKELERVSVLEQEKEKTLKEKQDQLNCLSGEKENLHIRLNAVQNYLAEIKKAKTVLDQARKKQNQQALQQKEMTHHYRQFIKCLYTLIISLEKDYLAIKKSYTWRIGNLLIRCMEILLFRKKRPLVTDHLEQVFQEYKKKMPLFEPSQRELTQFKRWVKQIEKDFIDLFASKRWKAGNGFVFIMGGTRFSRKNFTARDHIKRLLENFDETYNDKQLIDINLLESNQLTRQIDSEDKKKTDASKGGRIVSKPKISIIIPVFNKKDYIESCINSLFQKEYENLEVICVNDASEDGSDSILHDCARNDSRIRVFSHKANSGASAARNTGISLSDGKYLFFLDADDIIAENALAEMAEIAEEQRTDIVRGKITGIMPDGSNRQLAAEHLLHKELQYKVKWAEEESLWFYWYFTANLYRASFITKNCIIFPRNIRNEDPFFLCRCFLAAENICLYPELTYYYRIGAEQAKKTPSLSFLTGWSMGNYYLYQLFQTQYVQSQYFMLHFPSLLAHSQNAVKYLGRERACSLLKYIQLIFSHANIEFYKKPDSQPWTRKKRFDKQYIDYVQMLQAQPLEGIYDYLAH